MQMAGNLTPWYAQAELLEFIRQRRYCQGRQGVQAEEHQRLGKVR